MDIEEKLYRAETCQQPFGETGDYDSWIELVTPDLNLQCFDINIEVEQVEELAEKLNKHVIMEQAIKDVLQVMGGNSVPNMELVKSLLLEAVK